MACVPFVRDRNQARSFQSSDLEGGFQFGSDQGAVEIDAGNVGFHVGVPHTRRRPRATLVRGVQIVSLYGNRGL